MIILPFIKLVCPRVPLQKIVDRFLDGNAWVQVPRNWFPGEGVCLPVPFNMLLDGIALVYLPTIGDDRVFH